MARGRTAHAVLTAAVGVSAAENNPPGWAASRAREVAAGSTLRAMSERAGRRPAGRSATHGDGSERPPRVARVVRRFVTWNAMLLLSNELVDSYGCRAPSADQQLVRAANADQQAGDRARRCDVRSNGHGAPPLSGRQVLPVR